METPTRSRSESGDFLESLDKQLLDLKCLLNKTEAKGSNVFEDNFSGLKLQSNLTDDQNNNNASNIENNNQNNQDFDIEHQQDILSEHIQKLENCIRSVQDEKFELLEVIQNLNLTITDLVKKDQQHEQILKQSVESIEIKSNSKLIEYQQNINNLIEQNNKLKIQNRELLRDNLTLINTNEESKNPMEIFKKFQVQIKQLQKQLAQNNNNAKIYELEQQLEIKTFEIEQAKLELLQYQQKVLQGEVIPKNSKNNNKSKTKSVNLQANKENNPNKKKLIHKKTNKSAIDKKNIIQSENTGRTQRATRNKKDYKQLEKMQIEEEDNEDESLQSNSNNNDNMSNYSGSNNNNNSNNNSVKQQLDKKIKQIIEQHTSQSNLDDIEEQQDDVSLCQSQSANISVSIDNNKKNNNKKKKKIQSYSDFDEEEEDPFGDESQDSSESDKSEDDYCPSMRISKVNGSIEDLSDQSDNEDSEEEKDSKNQKCKQQQNKKKQRAAKANNNNNNKKKKVINNQYTDLAYNCIENYLYN